jgi:hypothetical protein
MEPVSVELVVEVHSCDDRVVGGAVDGGSGVIVEGQSVELVIVVHSCDEDIDARGVVEPRDAGLDEELADVLCEVVVVVSSDESRLGRGPSVETRVNVSSLVRLLLDGA